MKRQIHFFLNINISNKLNTEESTIFLITLTPNFCPSVERKNCCHSFQNVWHKMTVLNFIAEEFNLFPVSSLVTVLLHLHKHVIIVWRLHVIWIRSWSLSRVSAWRSKGIKPCTWWNSSRR